MYGKDYELEKIGYTVTGKITGDNIPLKGAVVQLKDFGCANVCDPVKTSSDGTYSISDVPAGRMYSIHVSAEGFGNNKSGLYDVYDDTSIDLNVTSTFTISGSIFPATAELPATVQLKDKEGKSIVEPVRTEKVGEDEAFYIITDVPKGDGYTLEATIPGYVKKSTTPFNIVSYNVTDKDLNLEKDGQPIQEHTITAGVTGGRGIITPSGQVKVKDGENQTFIFTPERRYVVDRVTVDGKEVSHGGYYAFENVSKDHTINVEFRKRSGSGSHSSSSGSEETEADKGESGIHSVSLYMSMIMYIIMKRILQNLIL